MTVLNVWSPKTGVPTVNQDVGVNFEFSAEEFSKMVGFDDWHEHEFRVVQSGSLSWEGMVRVYQSKDFKSPTGRKSFAAGGWKVNDTFTLKSCSNPGKISSFHYQVSSYFYFV